MTKEQAIEQMKLGKKITHRLFGDEEWIKSNENGTKYILEDGVECSPLEFWMWRTDDNWNDGYSIKLGVK